MMKLIIDSKTHGKKEVLYDDEDCDKISKYRWRLHKNQAGNFYAIAHGPVINGKEKSIRMHHVIMNNSFIDHINGNGLDNRKENLRPSNHKRNARNRQKLYKKEGILHSKYKGVTRHGKKWRAGITVDGKYICAGRFENELDAALAYNDLAIKFFNEDSFLNKIKKETE